jgi:hypothetical protein
MRRKYMSWRCPFTDLLPELEVWRLSRRPVHPATKCTSDTCEPKERQITFELERNIGVRFANCSDLSTNLLSAKPAFDCNLDYRILGDPSVGDSDKIERESDTEEGDYVVQKGTVRRGGRL